MVQTGKVFLVGAGPGDVGLLTLRGAELLRQAEVVVYDALVSESVLALSRPGAKLLAVGKRKGQHTLAQERINALLVAYARRGKTVVRLKGGDPYLFGRGGEEASFLRARGVPFEVVPGVTAASAAACLAGIPLTHRRLSSAVVLVTGQEDLARKCSRIDWEALARVGTVCIYMGAARLAANLARLRRYLPQETPAAMLQWVATPRQQTVRGTLADLLDKVRAAGLGAPAIIIVGPVAATEGLDWFSQRPLFGLSVVVTRAQAQAGELARRLRELGAAVLEMPVLRILPPRNPAPLRRAARELARYDWVVFTSANGVAAFFAALYAAGRDARAFGAAKIAAVGPATAEALRARGLFPEVVPDEYLTENLVPALRAAGGLRDRRVLLPHSDLANDQLAQQFREAGATLVEVIAYRTVRERRCSAQAQALAQLDSGRVDLVTFTSPSTVENFWKLAGEKRAAGLFRRARAVSIGPVTSRALRQRKVEAAIEARVHTIPGIVEALLDWTGQRRKEGGW